MAGNHAYLKGIGEIVELKYGNSADAAIQQIKDRNYTQTLEGYSGEILLVGINYDRENRNKPHSCKIERHEKSFGRKTGREHLTLEIV